MAFVDFDDFCGSLCTLVGVQAPRLVPDEHGVTGFTVSCDGVDIGFMKGSRGEEPGLLMIASFGVAEEANELETLRDLLNTNFLLAGVGAPAFVRNPVTGELSLHQSCLLSQASAPDVYQLMIKAADTVTRWKAGSFSNATSPREFQRC